MKIVTCSLPKHGVAPYRSITIGTVGKFAVRFSIGGYNLGWTILHYRGIATHFSFGRLLTISLLYRPYSLH